MTSLEIPGRKKSSFFGLVRELGEKGDRILSAQIIVSYC